jgi:hypothetical protein
VERGQEGRGGRERDRERDLDQRMESEGKARAKRAIFEQMLLICKAVSRLICSSAHLNLWRDFVAPLKTERPLGRELNEQTDELIVPCHGLGL